MTLPTQRRACCRQCQERFSSPRVGRTRLYCSVECAKAAARQQKLRPPRVTPEAFVRAWQAASSLAEVAAALDMTEHTAEVRAWRYRAQGVQLRDLREVQRLDVDALNRIAAERPAR